jgi:flagellar capping protein FliD
VLSNKTTYYQSKYRVSKTLKSLLSTFLGEIFTALAVANTLHTTMASVGSMDTKVLSAASKSSFSHYAYHKKTQHLTGSFVNAWQSYNSNDTNAFPSTSKIILTIYKSNKYS